MRQGTVLLVIVLLAAPLAGCLGGDGDADEPLQEEQADVTESLGGIQGVVTDNAVQPIVGANLTLEELGETATTANDGSYAFSRIQPGTYTMIARAEGFVTTKETVTVEADEVATVDLLLTHLTSDQAFMQQQELVGFVECGAGWWVTPMVLPYSAVAACAVPNTALEVAGLSGNATNDRFMHVFDLEAPVSTVVYEMTWGSENTALSTNIEVAGFPNDDEATFHEGAGLPPLYARLDEPVFQRVATNFTELCEGANGTEANDNYCGFNFWDKGWPLQVRVFASSDCSETPARVCPVLQEEFTHYVSAFYNEPAPDGFAILDENPP